jgi:hypothetical protein
VAGRQGSVAAAAVIPSDLMENRCVVTLVKKGTVTFILWVTVAFFIAAVAQAQERVKDYWDKEYGYEFSYPAGWALQEFPEGQANRDMRVLLQGPDGSSFMVVVGKLPKPFTREEFDASPDKHETVEKLIQQTISDVYTTVSRNLQATAMKVGTVTDLSSETEIKYYISTLHTMKNGRPIIVAGIHEIPFSQDYRIDFIMTTFWDKAAEKHNETLKAVFNSFHMVGENGATGGFETPEK